MKKYLFKVLVYILSVAIIVLPINDIYKRKLYNDGCGEETKFLNVPNNIQICNLGSSHGVHSYYYEDLEDEYTCFNFALDSQSLSYDERILEAYQDKLAPGGVVIIDISFFACWGYSETKYESFESLNKRYYRFLPAKLIKQFDLYTYIMVGKLPILCTEATNVVSVLFSPTQEDTEVKSYPQIYTVVDTGRLAEDTEASTYRHIFENKRDENGELFYNVEEIQALYDIVSICKKHNVTPIFVTVPYLKEYTDTIQKADEDFFEQFYSWIYSVSEELGVAYFDYSLDERFTQDYSLYYNGDHMNSNGAKKFTNILYDEVIKSKLKVQN